MQEQFANQSKLLPCCLEPDYQRIEHPSLAENWMIWKSDVKTNPKTMCNNFSMKTSSTFEAVKINSWHQLNENSIIYEKKVNNVNVVKFTQHHFQQQQQQQVWRASNWRNAAHNICYHNFQQFFSLKFHHFNISRKRRFPWKLFGILELPEYRTNQCVV